MEICRGIIGVDAKNRLKLGDGSCKIAGFGALHRQTILREGVLRILSKQLLEDFEP